MYSEISRWKLVDDFVKNFNNHRAEMFIPGDCIYADELISRWYGLGGECINIGLPMYVDIDRNLNNGCKIQDAASRRLKIMIRLKLVKIGTKEVVDITTEDDNGI